MGETRKTTKATAEKALAWAQEKALHLDSGVARQWIDRGDAEALEALRGIAGTEEGAMRRLVEDVRGAVKWLDGGTADLTAAARWFAEHGPLKVERTTLGEAAERFLAEYDKGSRETRRTFGTEIDGFLAVPGNAEMPLLELDEGRLEKWVRRKVGKADPAARTLRNRITTWVTFLNRCRDWRLLAPGKHAADVLRKPVIPDAGKEILTVEQGRKLLAAVREHDAELEGYLLIAGWLGLRPSEVQRLTWDAFDWTREQVYCHVSHTVAGKTSSERYVPVDARVARRLQRIFLASGKKPAARCCRFRSREFLSVLARAQGVVPRWPADVLRHSFCSYRIAVTKSLDTVADEAGNSPSILKSHYRRPLRHEDGLAWWSLLDA